MSFDDKSAELTELLTLLCDGKVGQAEWERLEALLLDDPEAQELYRRFIALDVELAWRATGRLAPSQINPPTVAPTSLHNHRVFSRAILRFFPAWRLCVLLRRSGGNRGDRHLDRLGVPRVDSSTRPSGSHPSRSSAWRERLHPEPEMVFVGRVTGMSDDCQWADQKTGTFNYAYVPLGRKYALASGLMEITYDTGARVILQGPCTYTVESKTGGYLLLGRLTARVGAGGGGRGTGRREKHFRKSTINNRQSPISRPPAPNPPLPCLSSALPPPSSATSALSSAWKSTNRAAAGARFFKAGSRFKRPATEMSEK